VDGVRRSTRRKIFVIQDLHYICVEELAAKAKAGCPVSKLMNARITLDAVLVD
jgi:organic hydroperoxide reductase OsmC/OhrA